MSGPVRRRRPHRRTAVVVAPVAGALAAALLAVQPAVAVNADHGDRIVSAVPSGVTPHIMNGSVQSIVQLGSKIYAVGTFTKVSPAATFSSTADDLVRNRIVAFDATTGAIDTAFDPNLGGAANSIDTDGTHLYVGGAFGSVGGSTAKKRLVKLTTSGAVVSAFKAVPNAAVNDVVVRGSRVYIGGDFASVKVGTTTTARTALAALDATSSAVLASVDVPFSGVYDPALGGGTNIKRLDLTADGSKLVAVGNFSSVGGSTRSQVAVLATPPAGTASVAAWATNRFDADHNDCAGVFDTFTRDVDVSPDGSYFVVTTTGAFAGGAYSGTMCDTTTRWELASTGNDPTWTNYTGGDTTYGVAITGSAVYVGGHQRWQNNSFAGDNAGPGAVPREGIAALDPVNGLPLSWNPGRVRGVGAQAMYATPTGLWVGSDTTKIANRTRGRIAFLPLAGGKTVPPMASPTLPTDLFLAERASCTGGEVLHRLNTGGPALVDPTLGPDWTVDDAFRNTGQAADWGSPAAVDATVPPCTTPTVFRTERWDDSSAPELAYALPVEAGRQVQVRLYFADRCSCTSTVGSRVFDVSIDGTVVLDDFDVNAAVGHDKGTMRAFPVTSDGTIDIALGHVVENPLLNAIEVVDATAGGPQPTAGTLLRRPVDATGSPTGPATPANTSFDWGTVRGAFVVGGTLYYGLADGALYARTFNAATGAVGAQRAVNLYDDPDDGQRIPFAIAGLSGAFYDPASHRIYYTLVGDPRLYYRYFTPESEIVGAQTFDAATSVDLSTVSGLTLAGGRVFFGSAADGSLRSVTFSAGGISGSATVVDGDGSWRYRAMFAPVS